MTGNPRVVSPEDTVAEKPAWEDAPWYNRWNVVYVRRNGVPHPDDYPIVMAQTTAAAELVVQYHEAMRAMAGTARSRRAVHEDETIWLKILNQDDIDIESGDNRFALFWENPCDGYQVLLEYCHSATEAGRLVTDKKQEYAGRYFDWMLFHKAVTTHEWQCSEKVSREGTDACTCPGTWQPCP